MKKIWFILIALAIIGSGFFVYKKFLSQPGVFRLLSSILESKVT